MPKSICVVLMALVALLVAPAPVSADAEPPLPSLRLEGLGTAQVQAHADFADGRSVPLRTTTECSDDGRVCAYAFYDTVPIDGFWLYGAGGGGFTTDGTLYRVEAAHTGTDGSLMPYGAGACQHSEPCGTSYLEWLEGCSQGIAVSLADGTWVDPATGMLSGTAKAVLPAAPCP